MVLFGALVNGLCIFVGTLLGLFFTKIPERFKETVMSGVGLVVLLIGLQMALETENIVIVLLSLLSGAMIGEAVHLEDKLEYIGRWIERKFTKPDQTSSVAQGFITASLIFVIGALAVIGALDSGLRNDHEVLVTKAIIDGFVSLVLTSTLGIGVIFSVIPVVLYEGSIALLATQINNWIPQHMLDLFIIEMTATGGLMIVAIGLNLLKITKIRVANLLPALLTVGLILTIAEWF
ncbi:DUF554 domain-containing protein [Halobacillus sp. GSS1]|uniref:DUF554 domain-containing protein n=1 Tax=unclassified Halobacillus TaxID=2636472 RepID=UPI001A8CA31C|nr:MULTISPECIES: DUF554 domain-containing protein [unclassified Halobacillus]MBN9654371.1 DUF554 domain-containing protein [Halobacillus sp. GSS1]MEC3884317.1 DUF554 domain-containing protein [Halobacillus sp. HZG1]